MLKYKINIADALERKGFNTYSINRICMILDMQPKDLIEYVENEEEKKKYNF